MYGCIGYGSNNPGVPVNAINADVPLMVIINGADYTTITRHDSITISDAIDGRSTCKFTIRDDTLNIHVIPGESVYIIWHGIRIFGGTVETVQEETPDNESTILSQISCVDFSAMADRYFVSNRYENMTIRAIVTDLVNVQTGLHLDGVSVVEVQEGSSVAVASFNFRKASDCFRDLAKESGMQWNINAHRSLMFFDRATYISPFSVGDTNPVHRSFSIKKTRGLYRNRQFLRAGRDKTGWLTDHFRGSYTAPDGGGGSVTYPEKRNRTFILSYDLAELQDSGEGAPYELWVKRGVDFKRVGINGIDKDGDVTIPDWKQWFVEYGSREINQNSASDETNNPTLQPDEVLEVQFKGYFPIISDVENHDEIEYRKSIEGGSGEYQSVEDDEGIDGREFAQSKADMLLSRYGRIPNEITYETDVPGLMSGQLQTNLFSVHGLSSIQFLIVEVRFKIMRGPMLRCTVRALDGDRQDGWAEFFRAQWLAGRKFVIRENEKIDISKSSVDVLVFSDLLTESVHDGVTLLSWTGDPYTWALVGLIQDSGYAYPLPGWVVGRSKIGVPYGS